MAYTSALRGLLGGIGTPPSQAQTPSIGTPGAVAAQPHVEAPPYDVAHDPGWHGILDPNDHPLRNFLNGLSPEERQLLLMRLGAARPSPVAARPQ